MQTQRWGNPTDSKSHAELEPGPVVKRRNRRQLDKTRARLLALAKSKPNMEATVRVR